MKKRFYFNSDLGVAIFFGKMLFLPNLLPALSFIRGLFPSLWARGPRCCDNGGQVYRWYRVFVWNDWHLKKLMAEDIGDGPDAWQRLSFRSAFKSI